MAYQFEEIPDSGVSLFDDELQEQLTDLSYVGNGAGTAPYSISSGIVGAVDNQMIDVSPQPGTVIRLDGYQPQQLLLVGDGLQQQGLCTITLPPGDTTLSQDAQFVSQSSVQPLVFETQSAANSGFFVNSVPLAGPGWVYSDPKAQHLAHSSTEDILQNLLEQSQGTMVSGPDQATAHAPKDFLVMLPSGEQQFVKLQVPSNQSSSNPMAEAILPMANHDVGQMFGKQMFQEPGYDKNSHYVVQTLKNKEGMVVLDKTKTQSPSPAGGVVIGERMLGFPVKRDPLEQSENCFRMMQAAGSDGNYPEFLPTSQVSKRSRNTMAENKPDSAESESQEVPKYLEVMAVCSHCGYTSMDFNVCQRCKRKLPLGVKTVPVSKSSPDSKLAKKPSNPEVSSTKFESENQALDHDRKKCKKKSSSSRPISVVNIKSIVLKKAERENLEAMAVCPFCGYTSKDVDLCERCRRHLPDNIKFVLTPKVSTAENKRPVKLYTTVKKNRS